jgi:hypothetical protein
MYFIAVLLGARVIGGRSSAKSTDDRLTAVIQGDDGRAAHKSTAPIAIGAGLPADCGLAYSRAANETKRRVDTMDETTPEQGGRQQRLRVTRREVMGAVALLLLYALFRVGAFAYNRMTAPTLEEVKEKVAELNAKLPSKTDDITTLEKVTLEGKEIVYRYRIGASADGLAGDDLKGALEPEVRPAICAAPMLDALMRNGYTVRYRYLSIERMPLTEIVVEPGECGSGCALPPRAR